MNTKDLINKVKEWNTNLEKHADNIPYTKTDEQANKEIIEKLKEYDKLKDFYTYIQEQMSKVIS